jgi:hypothetical protein
VYPEAWQAGKAPVGRKPTRPEWIAHRDFAPIEPVADGALLDYARGYRDRAAAE